LVSTLVLSSTSTAIAFLTPPDAFSHIAHHDSLQLTQRWAVSSLPRRATPKGLPSSLTQHRLQMLYLPQAPFSVRDTRKRNPAKLDLDAGTQRERRRIDQACLILLFTDATDPWWAPRLPCRGAATHPRPAGQVRARRGRRTALAEFLHFPPLDR
jgi:hypothetical protein